MALAASWAVLAWGSGLAGQAPPEEEGVAAAPTGPEWTLRWSPIATRGTLPRELPGAEARFSELLSYPRPRVGLFWTTANPGGLVRELPASRAVFQIDALESLGDYRRPLDPGLARRDRASGFGWGPVGRRGAAIGRIVVDRTRKSGGAFAGVPEPHGSAPFPVLDTLGEALSRTAARLEGAGAWRAGRVGVGLGLAFEAEETRTRESLVPKTTRTARPGATLGVSWEASDGIRLGASGGWQQSVFRLSILSVAAGSRAYAISGYTEPTAINLAAAFFDRRVEQTVWHAGLGAAGQLGRASWVGFLRREETEEDRFDPGENEPDVDRWSAAGWTAGAALQTALGPAFGTVDLRYTTLDGEGRPRELGELGFRADEEALRLSGELRLEPDGGWGGALSLGLGRESRDRRDLVSRALTSTDVWLPWASLEVSRPVGERVAVAFGGATSQYAPSADIPDPADVGPAFERWVAPGLALEATEARAWALVAGLRWAWSADRAVILRGGLGETRPVDPLPDVPDEVRRRWGLSARVVMGG